MYRRMILTVVSLLVTAAAAQALDLKLTGKGLSINAGSMGGFSLPYPELNTNKGTEKPIEVRQQGGKTTLKYAGGTVIVVSLAKGKMTYAFSGQVGHVNLPPMRGHLMRNADGGGPVKRERPSRRPRME